MVAYRRARSRVLYLRFKITRQWLTYSFVHSSPFHSLSFTNILLSSHFLTALSDTLDTLNEPVSIAASSNPQPSQPPITSSNSSAVNSSSDSGYSDWSAWSKCSATCSPKAVMSRERTCKVKTGCQGLYKQTKPCQLVKCPGTFSPSKSLGNEIDWKGM